MIKKYFKRPISTSFSPNFQKDDFLLSLKLILGIINKSSFQNAPVLCRTRLSKHLKTPNICLFSSGRAALYYSLKSLKLKDGDEVIIQAFTCSAVPNAILWAGLHPIYADIDKNTYNINVADLKSKITNKTRVIILQHTFGIPAPIKEIQLIAKKHDILVIEDCAHGFSSKYKNRSIGTFGDISILSFGRDKNLSCVFGGAVSIKNKLFARRLKIYEKGLIAPSRGFVLQQLFYLILYTISLPIYNLFLGKFLLWGSAKIGVLSKAVGSIEKQGGKPRFINYSLSPKLCVLLLNQLEKIAEFNKRRLFLSKLYSSQLNRNFPNYPLLRFPYMTCHKQRLLTFAKRRCVYLGDWYSSPIVPPIIAPLSSFYKKNSCPVAEKTSARIINLPTHINISNKEAQKVVDIIKKFESKTINDNK